MLLLIVLSFFVAVNCDCVKYLDLTWPFDNNTIYWRPNDTFQFTDKFEGLTGAGFWYSAFSYAASEHGGTHLDAPYHFEPKGWTVGQIPLNRLIAKGALVDISNSTTNLTPQHLEDWQIRNGPFESGTILLIKFGYSKHWPNKTQYLGIDYQGIYNFPGISKEAAEMLANSGKFYGVGVDTASVDTGNSATYPAHRTLAKFGLFNMENVKLMEILPAKNFKLFALPMKTEGGTGAPLRLIAEIPC